MNIVGYMTFTHDQINYYIQILLDPNSTPTQQTDAKNQIKINATTIAKLFLRLVSEPGLTINMSTITPSTDQDLATLRLL